MKKRIITLIVFICVGFSSLFSQTALNKKLAFNFNEFPKEKIFVHFNSSFLVTGENLLYKIYCLNGNSNKLSSISKIAYIELINAEKETIFRHKIILNSGVGKGEFFIKTAIPSGNYKLVAYTQWMRNGGVITFFQNDITIINPFVANKQLTVKIPKQKDTVFGTQNLIEENEIKPLYNLIQNEYIAVNTNKKRFQKREKVTLTIKGVSNKFSYGNYSISIKKIDSVNATRRPHSNSITSNKYHSTIPKDSIFFLPELRGELIEGTVLVKESNTPIFNVRVALSIPGENAIFKIATTNKAGVFYFNLDKEYKNSNAIIQVIDSKRDEYVLAISNYRVPDYNDFVFNDFKLSPTVNNLILKKSIFNQIENAYHTVKIDSIQPLNYETPSYKNLEKNYSLEEYSRFNTLKETVTEVIDAVYLLQKKGDYTFHIKTYNDAIKTDLLPLVLIDGVLIQDHNSIIDYNARNIKSIGVLRDQYNYGGHTFMGIISIKTLKGDYFHPIKGGYIKSVELDKPLVNKKYFKQEYNDNFNYKRIPDFRNQLLWQPDFVLSSNEALISFYTSNITGNYEICLEGFTNDGKPVSIREIIRVE